MISIESFIAGFCYGGTTVLVGQPMETLKTLTQVNHTSLFQTASNLYSTSGVRGFYRGGVPLLLGGGLMRSAQFGVYNSVQPTLEKRFGKIDPKNYWLGCINPHVVVAGWAGGIGRGLVEGPFEMVKVRRQVVSGWSFKELSHGFGTTILRNSFLFAAFVIYMDIYKQKVEPHHKKASTPFLKAGICANLAWLTIWPLDVIKTRRQSGLYAGKSVTWLIQDVIQKGHMFRGLGVGMLRSFISNGLSMEVYTIVERELKTQFQKES